MLGVLLTQWTIRLALLGYVGYLAVRLTAGGTRWPRGTRWLWTAACGLFLLHAACAFQFYHGWSHAAAWESTARQTQELLGVPFGAGIYFSYLFAAVWMLDVVRAWVTALDKPPRRLGRLRARWTAAQAALRKWEQSRGHLLVHAYLLFIAINGAMVFEAGPTRFAGAVACLLLAGLAAARGYNMLSGRQSAPVREPAAAGRSERQPATDSMPTGGDDAAWLARGIAEK
jgi:hypothetical protein